MIYMKNIRSYIRLIRYNHFDFLTPKDYVVNVLRVFIQAILYSYIAAVRIGILRKLYNHVIKKIEYIIKSDRNEEEELQGVVGHDC